MGLLDNILNGSLDIGGAQQDEWKRGALEELLARLASQTAEQAKANPPGKSPVMSGPMMTADPGQWQTSMTEGPTQVDARPPVGQAYTAPDASVVPDDFARRAAAAGAQAAPRPATQAPSRAPSLDGPTTQQKFTDFFTALGGGQVPDRGRELEQRNATFQYMISKGTPEEVARNVIMSGNANLMNAVLGGKTAPQIVDLGEPGPYGQPAPKGVVDPATGELRPLSSLYSQELKDKLAGAPGAAGAPAQSLPGQAQSSPAQASAIVPNAAPAASAGSAPIIHPTPLGTGTQPAAASAASPAAPTVSNDFVAGPPVQKTAEGSVHKISPDGRGYLYDRRTRQPIVESKAEADARAKGTEKQALDKVDQQQQMDGVKNIIDDARKLTQSPGFDKGLNIAQFRAELPWVGQVNPVGAVHRMVDRESPANSVNDEIGALQARLNLVVGRAYMKGQGQVSNFERSMVADAVGALSSATSKADFQMRLNSIERMIEDMNAGRKIEGSGNYNARPTEAEVGRAFYEDPRYGMKFRDGAVKQLADKYKVNELDMQNYLNTLIMRAGAR